jgi:hypothetical protein
MKKTNNDLIRITSNYFCAGAELHPLNLICVKSANIIKYMIGWKFGKIKSYCDKKKWKLEMLMNGKWKKF